MITYPVSNNSCKKSYLQCYRLYNLPFFRSSHWRCSVRKGVLRNFSEFSGKHLCQSLFLIKLQAETTASDLSRVFSWSFLFTSFQQKNEMGNTLMELKDLLFCSSIDLLTSKILKEIWQMVIWYENVFKENFMLQFSWLEEFR